MSFKALSFEAKRGVILDRDNYKCQDCGGPATQVDHMWPRAAGGTDEEDNLRAICGPCNKKKGDQTLLKFLNRWTAYMSWDFYTDEVCGLLYRAAYWHLVERALIDGADPMAMSEWVSEPTDQDIADQLPYVTPHIPVLYYVRPSWVNQPDREVAA